MADSVLVIHQGDALTIPVDLEQSQLDITPDMVSDVEITVGMSLRRLYSGETVQHSAEDGKWSFRLTQKDTFGLRPGNYITQARVKYKNEPEFDVTCIDVGTIVVLSANSREEL